MPRKDLTVRNDQSSVARGGVGLLTPPPATRRAGGWGGAPRSEFGQKLPVKYPNKVTFKGQLCAVSCHPAQHRRPVA